jgi:hypothetical protein
MNTKINLGGRQFEVLKNRPFEAVVERERLLRKGGLARLSQRPDETTEQFRRRVEERVSDSGIVFRLLGVTLTPTGESWTPQIAEDTTEFIANLHGDRHDALIAIRPAVEELIARGARLGIEIGS